MKMLIAFGDIFVQAKIQIFLKKRSLTSLYISVRLSTHRNSSISTWILIHFHTWELKKK